MSENEKKVIKFFLILAASFVVLFIAGAIKGCSEEAPKDKPLIDSALESTKVYCSPNFLYPQAYFFYEKHGKVLYVYDLEKDRLTVGNTDRQINTKDVSVFPKNMDELLSELMPWPMRNKYIRKYLGIFFSVKKFIPPNMSGRDSVAAFIGAFFGFPIGRDLFAPDDNVDDMEKALQNDNIWPEIARQSVKESFKLLKEIYTNADLNHLSETDRIQFSRIKSEGMGLKDPKVTSYQVYQIVRYWKEFIKYYERS